MTKENEEFIPEIVWKVEKRKVKDLKDHPDNPREISIRMLDELKKSIQEDGIFALPYINTDNTIIGGHQRKQAFTDLGIKETLCLVPDKLLNEQQVKRVMLRGNKISGEFDMEKLFEHFSLDEMLDGSFFEDELKGAGFDLEKAKGELDIFFEEDKDADNSKKPKVCPNCGVEL